MQITDIKTICYHCGLECEDEIIEFDGKPFCCHGCKVVYGIISQNNLCEYYEISQTPGLNQKLAGKVSNKFSILNTPEVKQKFIRFSDEIQTHIVFSLPQMHCSSCIWLLENLYKLNPGIISSRVDFTSKEIYIVYKELEISIEQVADLCSQVGYTPYINLGDLSENKRNKTDKSLILKLGIAGFCFGNVMMMSLPEYFSDGGIGLPMLNRLFQTINLVLGTLTFIYPASEFHISAWKSLRKGFMNIDVPIVLALIITYLRSIYEIVNQTGAGYMDSLAGITFFMLIGRYLQSYTHKRLSFERDYKSYFPIAITVKREQEEVNIPVLQLKIGDRIIIRNNELIPADALLFYGDANIDYSFVTGESAPVKKGIGEIVHAGGKQIGSSIELEVIKEVSNSYLTRLWNNDTFKDYEDKKLSFIHDLSRYFSIVLLSLVAIVAAYWAIVDPSRLLNAVTSMLIIACPCALLLSSTFTNGNILRIFGRNRFYLKNATVIESLAEIDTIVFDKTGTITQLGETEVSFEGKPLNAFQSKLIKSLSAQSSHPYSKAIFHFLADANVLRVNQFQEIISSGLSGEINGYTVKIGSNAFVGDSKPEGITSGKVLVSIDDTILGSFCFSNHYRPGLKTLINTLKMKHYQLALLSGDNESEKEKLQSLFGVSANLMFKQTPENKLDFIKELQAEDKKVMMIGDGLNDAGALKQSNVGIAVSDDTNSFSPACDGILDGINFTKLTDYIKFAQIGKNVIWGSFIVSIMYNLIGLYFAVQGLLSPVIAAIIMPSMSVSIILFTTGLSSLFAKKYQL